jgi:hypothetical protein
MKTIELQRSLVAKGGFLHEIPQPTHRDRKLTTKEKT